MYIDDEDVFAASHELCCLHLSKVLDTFASAGFVISSSKTYKPEDISQVKSYLGFIINTVEMTIYASDDKIEKVKEALQLSLIHI